MEVYFTPRAAKILCNDIYHGFQYYIVSYGSHPCAYIEIPTNHKYYNTHYDDINDIYCHGGLTYSESYLLDQDNSWFLGWDYAHYGDFTLFGGISDNFDSYDYRWSVSEILKEVYDVIRQLQSK